MFFVMEGVARGGRYYISDEMNPSDFFSADPTWNLSGREASVPEALPNQTRCYSYMDKPVL